MGEALSARVSHLIMNIDSSKVTTSVKCSGLCVSTGTGSTSWNLSINRLPAQTVCDLLCLLKDASGVDNTHMAKELAAAYNRNLVFGPCM